MPISQKKAMNCTKKNVNRQDATVFVCTKHTCTVDWQTRATRTATDRYHYSPPEPSAGKLLISTRPLKMRLQR